MIIHLTKSSLFTVDPDKRFAREHNLPRGLWTELWRRYELLGYSIPELREYLFMKTGVDMRSLALMRWIFRTKVYHAAQPAIKKGAETAVSSMFGDMEWDVIKELTKNLRSSEHYNPKTLV